MDLADGGGGDGEAGEGLVDGVHGAVEFPLDDLLRLIGAVELEQGPGFLFEEFRGVRGLVERLVQEYEGFFVTFFLNLVSIYGKSKLFIL